MHIKITTLAVCLLAQSTLVLAQDVSAKPNVLFITVDDMNCDSVGAFGCKISGITPNIDRLATEGMRFENGHVTIAICQPTRAVWMTGRYPHRSGALGFDPIKRNVPTLLESLHNNGYFTGILAKVPHVVPTRRKAWDVIVPAAELKTGRDPKLYYSHTKSFLEKAKATERPFFLMANSQDPHRPFAGGDREKLFVQRAKKKKQDAKKGRTPTAQYPGVNKTYSPDEIIVPGFLPDLPEIRRELSYYFASVHRADKIVGSVLRALKESGLESNTLVMFVSDHGIPLPFAKTNCWYHSTRTPWIVRWPGVVKAGTVDTKHFVSGIDFAPTIFSATGLKPFEGMDGRSFLPLLKGKSQTGRDHVFTHINRTAGRNEYPMRAVQDAKFGYIFNAWSNGKTIFKNESQAGLTMKAMRKAAETDEKIAARVRHFLYRTTEEFYDYANDPDALHNLIDDPNYQTQIKRYRQMMQEHLKATADPQQAAFTRLVASPQ